MSRSRASAKQAGSSFERTVADGLAKELKDDRIDRAIRRGAFDRGDVANVRIHNQHVVVEVKNCARLDLGGWIGEAEVERVNDDNALAGVVIHKRRGKGQFLDQYATLTVRDLVALLTGVRPA